MTHALRLALAQMDFPVGDPAGNAQRVIACARRAQTELRAHAVVFPELCLCGYPPEDLLLRPEFLQQVEAALAHIRAEVRGIDVIVGYPHRVGTALFNAASLIRDGEIVATYRKQLLPNYGVFDEKRYFSAGTEACVVDIARTPVGLTICEDAWAAGPMAAAKAAGAQVIVNLNASPYHQNKCAQREQVVAQRARETQVPIAYVNPVGGQDELVFDGASFVVDALGAVTQRAPAFAAGLYLAEFTPDRRPCPQPLSPHLDEVESVYAALVLGTRDYVGKNKFPGALLGLSGGIDSALTLAIAVDALGAERVHAVMMPSRYTADMSSEDARAEAEALGVRFTVIPIEPMFAAFRAALAPSFVGRGEDTTEENLQARVRGTLLMALSNKTGALVLTTGNKSEMAVGYATLYGDMAGGFAVIKDVPKTLVYRLAEYRNRRHRNQERGPIPARVLTRAPSAELAPNQKDSDSLPEYPVLDAILALYIEQDCAAADIVAQGFDAATVERVIALVHRNEYKRRQAPPGVRITPRAFGRDWRYPITSGFGVRKAGD